LPPGQQLPVSGLVPGPDRATREELLRLAGVLSVRLQEPGRPMVTLAPVGQFQSPALLDLRVETVWSGLSATLSALTRSGSRLLLVVAPSPKRPQSILSIVLQGGDLDDHLKDAAASVALHGLAVAIPTGVLIHFALLLLLVRPMRRLTDSIAAFRADPERTPPMDEPSAAPDTRDEMAVAQRELAAMQRELRAALWRNARLAALGATVAKVSHDLRGILAPALLTAERLQGNTDATLRRVGDSIARTVERATELMRNTLEFAAEIPAAPREPVALRALVQEVADEVRLRHPMVQVQLAIGATERIQADRPSLRRALANLIRNAAEAGATTLRIGAEPESELLVVLTIEDDGPGLPEVVRANLFHPFVTSGKPGGTGLGLAITRDLIRAQGGEVGLVRTSPTGTTFRIALRAPAGAPRLKPHGLDVA
jgi:signal transduction histidine kinase